MKITIFLLTVVLYFNRVSTHSVKEKVEESLKLVEEEINKTKVKIEDEIRDINRYRKSLQFNFNSKIVPLQEDNVKTIRCFNNVLLEKIIVLVNNSKIHGKNPTKCYEMSQIAMRTININSYASLNKCSKEATKFVEQVQTNIDEIISTGETLTTELNRIFLDCHSRLPKIKLHCANKKIKKLEVRIKNFESISDSIKTTGDSASDQGYLHGISCYHDVVTEAREHALKVLVDAENCINNY
ncbi:uncharacterized protein LOC122520896 [Polistes fuscatus]|uniref:uncharacterized protein LOC122520896 n=1 Tax=Polistes fuscatus TaxID=30207 RepID=UPI001CA86DDE|nr:uncharacterized protein LOC122520896 [Polistes fuscatus]